MGSDRVRSALAGVGMGQACFTSACPEAPRAARVAKASLEAAQEAVLAAMPRSSRRSQGHKGKEHKVDASIGLPAGREAESRGRSLRTCGALAALHGLHAGPHGLQRPLTLSRLGTGGIARVACEGEPQRSLTLHTLSACRR